MPVAPKKIAVYAGSFDPMTNGHLWIIEQAANLFDKVVVVVGVNSQKSAAYSAENRMNVLKEATRHLNNVTHATLSDQFLVHFAKSQNASYLIRGVRTSSDLEYEKNMQFINSTLEPSIQSIVLLPPKELESISSSLIRGLIGPKGWEKMVSQLVPKPTLEMLLLQHK